MNWNDRHTYNFPTLIRFGAGVVDELAPHLLEQGKQRPLLVTDAGLAKLDFFRFTVQQLQQQGLQIQLFSNVDANPVKQNVLDGKSSYQESQCDSIIGFGGGAPMDVARAIALAAHHDRDLFDFDDALGGDRHVTETIPYFVTVPTTSGTGSEVGRSTVIAEDETHKKRILFSPRLLAQRVFADPELTLDLPPAVTAATGMDAFCHNLEAYLSRGFNPLCDGIALEGIRLVGQSLEKATHTPNMESRSQMMMAALMGATAFQKGLGIVHSLAHPLSTLLNTHHGLANAVMLPFGVEFNRSVVPERIEQINLALGLPREQNLAEWLFEYNAKLGLPTSLSALNVTPDHVDELAKLALEDVCHQCNPRVVGLADFRNLYQKALAHD
ncbi:MAG: iron-containing alcohol dehydrogenase [Planctomycetota bacterium]|nr:iron-containing alcohol dehydrogenase [Planctomycetota bacterium]